MNNLVDNITKDNFADMSIDALVDQLQLADDAYFNNGDPIMTDEQYDQTKLVAQHIDPTHHYFTGIGSSVRGDKVKLPYPMGSLDQIYQHQYIRWVNDHLANNADVVVSDKLDGISALIVYDRAGNLQIGYTRGDGIEGSDITRHLKLINSVPNHIDTGGVPYTVRGELIISESQFAKISTQVKSRSGRPYKNARNMVAGVINAIQNPVGVYEAIDFIAYSHEGSSLDKHQQLHRLAACGFHVVNHSIHPASSLDDTSLTDILNRRRNSSQYALDGVVIEFDSCIIRGSCKNTTNTLNPPYAVKYKVAQQSNYAETRVTGVTFSITKDGYCKPTIQFEPVDLVGVTIRQCTGFNPKFIVDHGIGEGAIIGIVRSGDVIPYCQTVVLPSPTGPAMPPYSGKWTETGVDYIIDDPTTNHYVIQQQLVDFFASIGVEHLGEGNINRMFEVGLTTPESIINLSKADLGTAVGSLAVGAKIYDSITEKLTDVPIYVLMGSHSSMGRGVGHRKMRKLWEAFGGDMSKCQDEHAITSVEGFSTKTAKKIVAGYPEFMSFLATIKDRVTIKEYESKPVKSGVLAGATVVVTGFRDKALEQFVESQGGKMGSSVSKTTTVVVAYDPAEMSVKLAKASALNIPIMSLSEFYKQYYQ